MSGWQAFSGYDHARRHLGHRVIETVDQPWYCLTCPTRSVAYELTQPRKAPMKLRITTISELAALPVGSVVARDCGVTWRKTVTGWRADGTAVRASATDAYLLADAGGQALVLLRHGWKAPSTPAEPTARDQAWLARQPGCWTPPFRFAFTALAAALAWKLARR